MRDLQGSSRFQCWNAGPGPRAPEKGWSRLPRTPSNQRVPLLRRAAKCQNKEEVRLDQTPAARHVGLRQETRRERPVALTVDRERAEKRGVLQCKTRPSRHMWRRGARCRHPQRGVSQYGQRRAPSARPHRFHKELSLDMRHVTRYTAPVIKTFADRHTQELFATGRSSRLPPEITRRARRKVEYIDLASQIGDLRVPPGNRLHKLAGDREGQYAIAINDRWRICFRFVDGDAFDVEITGYH